MGDFALNVRQKPMDFNRWQLGLSYDSMRNTRIARGNVRATDDGVPKRGAKASRLL